MIQRNSHRESTFDLSQEIHHLAREEELGEFYKVYPALKRHTNLWANGLFCSVLGGMLAVPFAFIAIVLSIILSYLIYR